MSYLGNVPNFVPIFESTTLTFLNYEPGNLFPLPIPNVRLGKWDIRTDEGQQFYRDNYKQVTGDDAVQTAPYFTDDTPNWTNILGGYTEIIPPLPLIERKRMAARLFLNIQIFVMYSQIVMGETDLRQGKINSDTICRALYLICDKIDRNFDDLHKQGFPTIGRFKKNQNVKT